MGFKNFLHEYFTFNRRERNGVFVLLSIILLLILYLSFADYFYSAEKIDFSRFEKEINEFEAEQKKLADSISEMRTHYFTGDPIVSDSNKTESNDSKEKNFHTSQKVYQKKTKNGNFLFLGRSKGERIELNSADTIELKKIKGIGSVFAKRIVKFRDALGGFVTKEQLLEVYGLDRERFDLISLQITLEDAHIKKININSASVYDLEKHPYINKRLAVAIFTHRTTVGDYTNVKDINTLVLTDEKLYDKIAPYLAVE